MVQKQHKNLKDKKRGRKGDEKTTDIIEALRLKGAPVTAGIINSIARCNT